MALHLIKLTAMLLLLGGISFFVLVWHPLFGNDQQGLSRDYRKLIQRIMLLGGSGFMLTILVRTWLTYQQYLHMDAGADFNTFMIDTAAGMSLLNLVLVPLLLVLFARNVVESSSHYRFAGLVGVLIVLVDSASSHAATNPGLLPYLNNVIHTLFAIIWAGGLCYFALIPWRSFTADSGTLASQLCKLDQRFYRMVLYMFIVVVASGAVLGFVHVHSEAALYITAYGKALGMKMLASTLLMLVLMLHLVLMGPRLKRVSTQYEPVVALAVIAGYRRWIYIELVLVTGLLISTAMMHSHEPPDTAPFLNPQSLELSIDGQPLRVSVQPVAGSLDSVRMEFFLPPVLAGGDSTQVYFSLSLPETGLILEQQEAVRVSADSYQGESTFPAPGNWQLQIEITTVSGPQQELGTVLNIPAQPLVADISAYLSPQAVAYSSARMITFGTGVLMVILYGWLLLQAGNGRIPRWVVLVGTGGVLFGMYLSSSVALVKTYPSTYWRNPEPLTAGVVERGQQAYLRACADCHGQQGKGDGPWAIENRGGIPDLGSAHMDVHTDGEIYWWIGRGIPELDMPPREQELGETQRWEVINYIRSLRHGTIEASE